MTPQDAEYGIRWVPTIAGALLVVWAFTWGAAGVLGNGNRVGTIAISIVLLAVGVALLQWGRRGISRSLRSPNQAQDERRIGR